MGPKTEAAIINYRRKRASAPTESSARRPLRRSELGRRRPRRASAEETDDADLDVSAYQGVIDFAKVKQSGYLAVRSRRPTGCIRSTPRFHDNWKDAKDAGVARFAYHFFHPNLDGAAQADLLLRLWTETLANWAGLDWETDFDKRRLDRAADAHRA